MTTYIPDIEDTALNNTDFERLALKIEGLAYIIGSIGLSEAKVSENEGLASACGYLEDELKKIAALLEPMEIEKDRMIQAFYAAEAAEEDSEE